MNRSTMFAGMLFTLLAGMAGAAPSVDAQDARARDWRGKICANCQSSEAPASRMAVESRGATKLVAANTCADPGVGSWFAEEQDHLTAFLNSAMPQFK